jgi:hypothetical protein
MHAPAHSTSPLLQPTLPACIGRRNPASELDESALDIGVFASSSAVAFRACSGAHATLPACIGRGARHIGHCASYIESLLSRIGRRDPNIESVAFDADLAPNATGIFLPISAQPRLQRTFSNCIAPGTEHTPR